MECAAELICSVGRSGRAGGCWSGCRHARSYLRRAPHIAAATPQHQPRNEDTIAARPPFAVAPGRGDVGRARVKMTRKKHPSARPAQKLRGGGNHLPQSAADEHELHRQTMSAACSACSAATGPFRPPLRRFQ